MYVNSDMSALTEALIRSRIYIVRNGLGSHILIVVSHSYVEIRVFNSINKKSDITQFTSYFHNSRVKRTTIIYQSELYPNHNCSDERTRACARQLIAFHVSNFPRAQISLRVMWCECYDESFINWIGGRV